MLFLVRQQLNTAKHTPKDIELMEENGTFRRVVQTMERRFLIAKILKQMEGEDTAVFFFFLGGSSCQHY